jgi:ABC-type uncharacterized transport system ATPase subunit
MGMLFIGVVLVFPKGWRGFISSMFSRGWRNIFREKQQEKAGINRRRIREQQNEKSNREIILAVEGLTVSFNGFKAVDDFSMYIDEGQIYVIIGPNGAGKTTVLDLICGKTRLTGGSIKFKDKEISRMKENKIVQTGVGRKFQNPSIYENLTVFENLELSWPKGEVHLARCSFAAPTRYSGRQTCR